MRITITGYEGLSPKNSNIYNIGKLLYDNDYLHKMICTYFKNIDIDDQYIVKETYLKKISHSILSLSWRYFSRNIPERYLNEMIFDKFSQKNFDGESKILLCTDGGLVQTIKKAKNLGIFSIILLRTPHPKYLIDMLSEESKKFGVKENSAFTDRKWVNNRLVTLKDCDAIFVKSNLVKESCIVEGISSDKIHVISNGVGVDTTYFQPNIEKKKNFSCLFIGHNSLLNGVSYLLEAWRSIDQRNKKLVICGVQNKKIIRDYKKFFNFDAPGSVLNPLKYYQESSIFVLPSIANSFPRVTLEAMSCGLPIIISEGVGSKDIIQDGKEGFVVPIRNSKAIAEKIQYFFDNPDEILRMGQNARITAERFNWNVFSEEVFSKIKEIHHWK